MGLALGLRLDCTLVLLQAANQMQPRTEICIGAMRIVSYNSSG
jgi:hypothetical protein